MPVKLQNVKSKMYMTCIDICNCQCMALYGIVWRIISHSVSVSVSLSVRLRFCTLTLLYLRLPAPQCQRCRTLTLLTVTVTIRILNLNLISQNLLDAAGGRMDDLISNKQ